PEHAGMRDLIRDLNTINRDEPALWEVDFSHDGFRWLEPNDAANNVVAFMRVSKDGSRHIVCLANLSPVPRDRYRVGLPLQGRWEEALNTDSIYYGGAGIGNMGAVTADAQGWHDQPFSAACSAIVPAMSTSAVSTSTIARRCISCLCLSSHVISCSSHANMC